ncbi:hypothetical protein [Paracoccus seriniphilus]|uniref:Uncharacterized protein n=1 Tax=Paracoccus seriniphilus TaxID=184748 RepID=A0A239PRF9_9RHOB|nr:hypothetical protein [Paracoccus seriniphilus]SNT72633.1 hypothetical protein SAMN05444959_103131 [Paracoccus seriniphilus]
MAVKFDMIRANLAMALFLAPEDIGTNRKPAVSGIAPGAQRSA